jgi:hypothetical protein
MLVRGTTLTGATNASKVSAVRRRPSLLFVILGCLAACGTTTSGGPLADSGSPPLSDAPASTIDASDASVPVAEASAGDAPPEAGAAVTTIRIHYPAGTHALAIRGSVAPWSWNTGVPMSSGPSDTWSVTTTTATTAFEFKPLLDDTTWSLGPNYKGTPGATLDVYPHFTQMAGQYSRAYDFTSTILANTRGIWIYQPPTYIENSRAHMPVLYMHDGQNLFDPAAAFGGNAWMVGRTMDAGAADASIAEAIVIGIENTADRINEYTPVADPQNGGGKGDLYLNMIIQELKPRVDSEMRTLPDRLHTSMMGSSLGGLISAYAGSHGRASSGSSGSCRRPLGGTISGSWGRLPRRPRCLVPSVFTSTAATPARPTTTSCSRSNSRPSTG